MPMEASSLCRPQACPDADRAVRLQNAVGRAERQRNQEFRKVGAPEGVLGNVAEKAFGEQLQHLERAAHVEGHEEQDAEHDGQQRRRGLPDQRDQKFREDDLLGFDRQRKRQVALVGRRAAVKADRRKQQRKAEQRENRENRQEAEHEHGTGGKDFCKFQIRVVEHGQAEDGEPVDDEQRGKDAVGGEEEPRRRPEFVFHQFHQHRNTSRNSSSTLFP